MVKQGDYVAVFVCEIACICYGRVIRVEEERIFLKLCPEYVHEAEPADVVLKPIRYAREAQAAVEKASSWIGPAIALAQSAFAPLVVAAAAAPGLAGGAASMSGLASIGAYAGVGAAGGIVIIAAAPAALGAAGVATLARGVGADKNATMAATGAGVVGGGAGVAVVGWTFIGASGSSITSALAALGGGSIASGGGGMAVGLVLCAAGPLALCAVTGAAALGAVHLAREREFRRCISEWEAHGGNCTFVL